MPAILLAAACGADGSTPVDADPAAADAAGSGDATIADAGPGDVDAEMAATPCTPSQAMLVDDPASPGDKMAGMLVDVAADSCVVENGTAFDDDRALFFMIQGGQRGVGAGLGRSLLSTSHGTTTGQYAGPLPDLTVVTVRLQDNTSSKRWDVDVRFDQAAGLVRVSRFEPVAGG
jgi:hypothetical protein